MSDAVVDASVVLALLRNEALRNFDTAILAGSIISAVNLSEVLARLISEGMPAAAASDAVGDLALDVRAFDAEAAAFTARLWPNTRKAGLSLGDRACIALGLLLDLPIITADRAWARLDFGRISVVR